MNQDLEHLKLLSIFHYIVGGITAFFALFPLLYVFIGIFALQAPVQPGNGGPTPAAIGWIFIIVGVLFTLAGFLLAAAMIATGRFLSLRKYRLFCLIVASLECLIMPFGTILGIFTIIVLIRQSVQDLFTGTAGPPESGNGG